MMFTFDPEKVLSNELNATGVTLEDLGWPDALTDGINALKIAWKAMFIFYVIGIIFAGLAVLGALVGVILNGRLSAFANWLLTIVSISCNLAVCERVLTSSSARLHHPRSRIRNLDRRRHQGCSQDQPLRR